MNVIVFNNPLRGNIGISSEHICQHCRPLLVHEQYMTSYLEQQRTCKIHIKKLAQWYGKNYLARYVFLNDEHNRTHIVSKISICLSAFDLVTQQELIESNLTFGNVLSRLGIIPFFSARHFFKRVTPPFAEIYKPYQRCTCQTYFGRFHILHNKQQRPLASIYEWIA